eukprot:TRINITY_DN3503_c0_g1_i1.p1 TRINITY_DN3503_c0_g1~~TRINITY_DN3503_c0_g1_i1.p1  ORF type:complete len:3203 (+),score=810.24 TRINITY_DN3503_c0_g1_i1:75-9611(+)
MNALAANMVSKMLSRYVEGITKEMMDINVFSGDLVLTDAKIRKSALEGFDLPFDVARGVVGKLTLKVPWAKLKTKRAELLIEGVKLLAGPRDPQSRTWSMEEEHKRNHERKMERLETFEDMRASKEGRSGGAGWSAKLMELVISNIKIEVKDVHIRFEDCTDTERPYAIGFIWDTMTLQPTTDAWEAVFLTELGTTINKMASLEGFIMYIRAERLYSTSDLDQQDWITYMSDTEAISGGDQYRVVSPLSLALKISQLTYSGLEDDSLQSAPLIESLISLARLDVSLTKGQYDCVLRVTQLLTNFSVAWEHALLRPHDPVKTAPRQWWAFAKSCIVKAIRKASVDRDRVKEGKKLIKEEYVFVWKLFVQSGRKKAAVPVKWIRLLTLYEDVLPALELISYRVISYRMIDSEKKKKAAEKKAAPKTSWFTKITQRKDKSTVQAPSSNTINRDLKIQPHKSTMRRKQYSFEVRECVLSLRDSITTPLLTQLVMKGLHLDLSDTKIDCTILTRITDMVVLDASAEENQWKQILGPETDGIHHASTLSIVSACYAFMKPTSKLTDEKGLLADTNFTLQTSRPMRLILNTVFLTKLAVFFRAPAGWSILSPELGIGNGNVGLSTSPTPSPASGRSYVKTLAQDIVDALEERHTSDIKIIAAAPTVVIPRDCSAAETEALVCNLGQLRVSSRMHLLEKAALRKRARKNDCNDTDTHEWWDLGLRGMKVSIRPCKGSLLLPATHGTDVLCETGAHLVYGSSLVPKREDIPVIITKGKIGPLVKVKLNHASLATVSEVSAETGRVLYDIAIGGTKRDTVSPPSSRQQSPVPGQSKGVAALIDLETDSLALELSLAPTGSGERPPACVVNVNEMKSRASVPLQGATSVDGEAAVFSVTAHDKNDVPATIMSSRGVEGKPLFSYTTDDNDAMLLIMHLSNPVLNPVPAAVRHAMGFFAPFTVGVPVITQDVLQIVPDAELLSHDLLITSPCELSPASVAFSPSNRLLVHASTSLTITAQPNAKIALLEGQLNEYCIVISSRCKLIIKGFEIYCTKRFEDYVMPGSGEYELVDCTVHSNADEVKEKHADEWKPYSCKVYIEDGVADLPDGFGMDWGSCNWEYSWNGKVVTSGYGCKDLRITAPPPATEARGPNMLSKPFSVSYTTTITQVSPSSFTGVTRCDISPIAFRATWMDAVALSESLNKIYMSIYPPDAPNVMQWSDSLTLTCGPVSLALCGSRGGAASVRLVCRGVDEEMTMQMDTTTMPKEAPRWTASSAIVLSAGVWDSSAHQWTTVLEDCQAVLDMGEKPTGLPRGRGWKTSSWVVDADEASLAINDKTLLAVKSLLNGTDEPRVQRNLIVKNKTGVDFAVSCTVSEDGTPAVTMQEAKTEKWTITPHTADPAHPVIGFAKYTPVQSFAGLHYIKITCTSFPHLSATYHLVPLVTFEKQPVWTSSCGRGRIYSSGGKWTIQHTDTFNVSTVLRSGPHDGTISPLCSQWLTRECPAELQCTELKLVLPEIAFRVKAFCGMFDISEAKIRKQLTSGIAIDTILHLECQELGEPSSKWVGYKPIGVVGYTLTSFYKRYDQEGLGKVESLLNLIADSSQTAEKIVTLLCKKWEVDVAEWLGSYPSALRDETEEASCEANDEALPDDALHVIAAREQQADDLAAWAMGEGHAHDAILGPPREWVEINRIDLDELEVALVDSPRFRSTPRRNRDRGSSVKSVNSKHDDPAALLWDPFLQVPEGCIPVIANVSGSTVSVTGPVFFQNKSALVVHLQCGDYVAILPPKMEAPVPASLLMATCLMTECPVLRFQFFDASKKTRSGNTAHTISRYEMQQDGQEWSEECPIPKEGENITVLQDGWNMLVKTVVENYMCMMLEPPLEIRNELPFAVTASLSVKDDRTVPVVPRDEVVLVHDFDVSEPMKVSLKIVCPVTGQPRTSRPLVVDTKFNEKHIPLLRHKDDPTDDLPILMTVHGDLGKRVVRLYTPIWLLNSTNFKLKATFGGKNWLLPQGTPVPHSGPCVVEGVPISITENVQQITSEGSAVVNVVVTNAKEDGQTVVMLSPMCVVSNTTNAGYSIQIDGEEGRIQPGGAYFLRNKLDDSSSVVLTADSEEATTFRIPQEGNATVVRIDNLWVLVSTEHDLATNTIHVTLGGRLPPSPLTVMNQSWVGISVGVSPCSVNIAPFSSSPVYFPPNVADKSSHELPVNITNNGSTETCHLMYKDGKIDNVTKNDDAEVVVEVRHKGGKGINGLVKVCDREMSERSKEKKIEVMKYVVRCKDVSVKADVEEVGNVLALRGKSPSGELSIGLDGSILNAAALLNDTTLDSSLLQDILSEQLAKMVPFHAELATILFPLTWEGSPLVSLAVSDLPCIDSDLMWKSSVGVKLLCEAADFQCSDEIQALTTHIASSSSGSSSLSDILANSGEHLTALKNNDEAAMKVGNKILKTLLTRRMGVDIQKVQDGDGKYIADLLLSHAVKSHFEGSSGRLLLVAGKHFKLVEHAHSLYTDPSSSAEARSLAEAMLHSKTKEQLLHAATQASVLFPELGPMVKEVEATTLDLPTTVEALQSLLGLVPRSYEMEAVAAKVSAAASNPKQMVADKVTGLGDAAQRLRESIPSDMHGLADAVSASLSHSAAAEHTAVGSALERAQEAMSGAGLLPEEMIDKMQTAVLGIPDTGTMAQDTAQKLRESIPSELPGVTQLQNEMQEVASRAMETATGVLSVAPPELPSHEDVKNNVQAVGAMLQSDTIYKLSDNTQSMVQEAGDKVAAAAAPGIALVQPVASKLPCGEDVATAAQDAAEKLCESVPCELPDTTQLQSAVLEIKNKATEAATSLKDTELTSVLPTGEGVADMAQGAAQNLQQALPDTCTKSTAAVRDTLSQVELPSMSSILPSSEDVEGTVQKLRENMPAELPDTVQIQSAVQEMSSKAMASVSVLGEGSAASLLPSKEAVNETVNGLCEKARNMPDIAEAVGCSAQGLHVPDVAEVQRAVSDIKIPMPSAEGVGAAAQSTAQTLRESIPADGLASMQDSVASMLPSSEQLGNAAQNLREDVGAAAQSTAQTLRESIPADGLASMQDSVASMLPSSEQLGNATQSLREDAGAVVQSTSQTLRESIPAELPSVASMLPSSEGMKDTGATVLQAAAPLQEALLDVSVQEVVSEVQKELADAAKAMSHHAEAGAKRYLSS